MPEAVQEPINVFEEVRKLNFPQDEYILVGSAILAAKGIRPTYDLDIVVSPALFEQCRSKGWELLPWTKKGMVGKSWLRKGIADLMLECVCTDVRIDLAGLIAEGEKINGIWFLSLQQLKRFKKDYGRQKDFDDITLIDKYLAESV